MTKLSTAALAIALLTTPTLAAAEGVAFPTRESVSIKVSTDGLNLSLPRDQIRLRGRMQRAIATACSHADDANAVYSSYSPDRQCYQEMALNAESKMQMYAQSGYTNSTASAVTHAPAVKN
ncbi:MAG TPA: UrcA family protein [Sphingobium sp.]|uniref:UrcA family protein n=1 Tax=Sphingobium sp. TaxID=1912891 RepID=UPI002ED0F636